MKEHCKVFENATLYRSGGDEFSLLAECEDCDENVFKEKVKSVAENICEIVN